MARIYCKIGGMFLSGDRMTADSSVEDAGTAPADAPVGSGRERMKALTRHCLSFRGSENSRAVFELAVTIPPFFFLAALNIYSFLGGHYAVMLPLTFLAGMFLVRLFTIQHDCGHGSFFSARPANEWLGRFISLLTFTPYDYWRRTHNMHHAASGNLSRRGQGAIETLTVAEFKALPRGKQILYRVYRQPFILLVLGIPIFSLIMQRIPPRTCTVSAFAHSYHGLPPAETWRSIVGLDIALLAVYGTFCYFLGWQAFLLAFMPVVMITAWVGGWLFYMQHQFEDSYFHHEEKWSFSEASLEGSSYYVLPKWLQWFTGNIGLHHIHHLCALIPNYKLQSCLDANEELAKMNRLGFVESLKCIRWALWDEESGKMVSFSDVDARQQPA